MTTIRLLCGLTTALALGAPGTASAYNEAVDGDLANTGASATFIATALGSNPLLGTTGNPGTGIDRDYFTITVAPGQQLSALNVLPGTVPLGLAFIGVQTGGTVTVAPNSGSAAGLLGQSHYAALDVGTNILPRIGTGAGASGFVGPLGAGNYAFWIQDFNPGSSTYAFDLVITQAVPEPTVAATLLAGLLALAWVRRRAGR